MSCPANRISRSIWSENVLKVLWFYKHFVPPGQQTGATDGTHLYRELSRHLDNQMIGFGANDRM